MLCNSCEDMGERWSYDSRDPTANKVAEPESELALAAVIAFFCAEPEFDEFKAHMATRKNFFFSLTEV